MADVGSYGLVDSLYRNSNSRPGRDQRRALIFEDREWSYDELSEEVRRVATGLAANGMQAGDRCAILMYNRPEYIVVYYALAHLGAVAVPLNYFLKPPEVCYALADSDCTWLVTEEALWPASAEQVRAKHPDVHIVNVDASGSDAACTFSYSELLTDGAAADQPIAAVSTDTLFLLQYTSGTTGLPKAAMHTHGNVLFSALSQIVDFQLTDRDVYVVVPALCWGAGFHDYAIGTWWRGGTVVLRPSGGFDGDGFCELVQRHGVTIVLLVPSVLRLVLQSARFGKDTLGSLRMVLCGGEHVPVAEIEQVQKALPECEFLQGYGLSEFPVTMTFLDGADAITKRGSAGKASISATVRVVDPDGKDVEPGEVGEIICRSPASTIGYLGRPEATGTMLVDGWLHTGDRGSLDQDGFLSISGRIKDMIISGGLNVYPREIERVLEMHPHVIEAAVVGVPHDRYQEVGRAIVVVDSATDVDELIALCRAELANFKVPHEWDLRTEPLPRTTSGKVQKYMLVTTATTEAAIDPVSSGPHSAGTAPSFAALSPG